MFDTLERKRPKKKSFWVEQDGTQDTQWGISKQIKPRIKKER